MTYWRTGGLNYLRYANLCASYVRQALKEPLKSKALEREELIVKIAEWEAGKASKPIELKLDE
eukprot:CAMPEP_0196655626 /NCGR_PEP_ID=MMETSP1086-20130531/5381_1 /TAXON_ID=77921 /ORGANISM="Cyanoptyche  gloeocystis , Strain SAG4.97" /LENGTH=62 /DNA_ID=CAMNT_0041988037 /DNA_START=69 /DNA_END=257 /DNA_ORIENTATION=-